MASRKQQPQPIVDDSAIKPGENPFGALAERYALAILRAADVRKLDTQVVERLLRCDLFSDLSPEPLYRRRGLRSLSDEENLTSRQRLAGLITACLKRPAPTAEIDGVARDNLRLLGEIMEFDEVDARVFLFTVVLQSSPALKELVESFGNTTVGAIASLVALATGTAPPAALRSLRQGRAVRSGLLALSDDDTSDAPSRLRLKDGVLDLVLTPGLARSTLIERFLPSAPASSLTWGDFDAMAESAATTRDLLGGALRTRLPGVNVLFYGVTGSGKTELARLVAQALGVTLHCASAEDSDGESLSAASRLTSLLLGHRLLDGTDAIMVFDELEDLFAGDDDSFRWPLLARRGRGRGRAHGMSKAWFNQLLESNPVPTVWISNEVGNVDPAFLRRFTFAVEFRDPSPKQRARVLSRHLAPSDRIAPNEVERLATRHAVPAAVFQRALAAARVISPAGVAEPEAVSRVIAPIDRLLNGDHRAPTVTIDADRYDLEALNTPVDLARLATRLEAWTPSDRPGVTLCLHGPPGTGKSEFVKYLARRLGRPVLYRRVSDLQSMWVGQTEKAIAAAFHQAEEEGSVLLFDEADSFLRDRREAHRSWEVTQVNEFLQRLESFRGIVACTTNLMDDLDEASLRRFVFKIPFGYLRPEQAAGLFDKVFSPLLAAPLDEAARAGLAADLGRIGNLAPGDFAAVARRLGVFGTAATVAECLEELRAEVTVRRRATRGPLGFGA